MSSGDLLFTSCLPHWARRARDCPPYLGFKLEGIGVKVRHGAFGAEVWGDVGGQPGADPEGGGPGGGVAPQGQPFGGGGFGDAEGAQGEEIKYEES